MSGGEAQADLAEFGILEAGNDLQMRTLVELVLQADIKWIEAHPDAAFSRFMVARRGPRTDTVRMTKLERFKSGLTFLCWGFLSLGAAAILGYVVWVLKLLSPDTVIFLVIVFSLTLWTMVCVAAGLCLLVRAII